MLYNFIHISVIVCIFIIFLDNKYNKLYNKTVLHEHLIKHSQINNKISTYVFSILFSYFHQTVVTLIKYTYIMAVGTYIKN